MPYGNTCGYACRLPAPVGICPPRADASRLQVVLLASSASRTAVRLPIYPVPPVTGHAGPVHGLLPVGLAPDFSKRLLLQISQYVAGRAVSPRDEQENGQEHIDPDMKTSVSIVVCSDM